MVANTRVLLNFQKGLERRDSYFNLFDSFEEHLRQRGSVPVPLEQQKILEDSASYSNLAGASDA